MDSLKPLGDQAALAYFAEENTALRFAAAVRRANDLWLVDVVGAYKSVAVFFDLDRIDFRTVEARLRSLAQTADQSASAPTGRLYRIPCCYGLQLDLSRVAEITGLSADEIIRLHSQTEF